MKTFKEYKELNEAKDLFKTIDGIRYIENSMTNFVIYNFDEFDVEEENGNYTRKGNIKRYEVENFKEEHGIELPTTKSKFPIAILHKDNNKFDLGKCTIVDSDYEDDVDFIKIKKQPRNTIYVYFINDGIGGLIHKDDIEKYKDLKDKTNIEHELTK